MFLRMAREYTHLQRAKRAGRGHVKNGLATTKPGECAVRCWACPDRERNLPLGWDKVNEKEAYLFRTVLALDANFKLKNFIRLNERDDTPLGPGWGAWVEPKKYHEHLRGYVGEKDISSCIAFAALAQKDTRNTVGLRVSGVGGCACARHECVRPNGLGDLQKGERYANMDFIAMSALRGFNLKQLTISYDIACQWGINLWERISKLPEDLHLDFESFWFRYGLPVWHATAHEESCTNRFSLGLIPGLGKTDGEGIERLWAELNAFAYHTKTMGLGHRADTLDDKINYHNFTKNLSQSDILRRKLMVATAKHARQITCWDDVNKSIDEELRKEWQGDIDIFEDDPVVAKSPFSMVFTAGPSEAEVRLELKRDEEAQITAGAAALHGTSATAFLTSGLGLEESQRRIKFQLSDAAHVSLHRQNQVEDYRLSFLSKLGPFRGLQQVYTMASIRALENDTRQREGAATSTALLPEDVKLYLPSALPPGERALGCQSGVAEMEARLREAQCTDALAALQKHLHAKRHLWFWKMKRSKGQKAGAQAYGIVKQIDGRIAQTAAKYRAARSALIALKGAAHAPHFQALLPEHISLDDVSNMDAEAVQRLKKADAGRGERAARQQPGTSKKVMLWIWTVKVPGVEGSEMTIHDSIRLEWCRAKARKKRWEEEVLLLREEMRRVLRSIDYEAAAWKKCTEVERDDLDVEVHAGVIAYALKQADWCHQLRDHFHAEFDVPLAEAAAKVHEVDYGGVQDLLDSGR
ncbi:unnamed protein product [Mycena citricolor]|uniref:CxC2-like cysteine cluster KDZ transposase-associated domain-containing protein n=1 Tax=Mycena citricolor TaxID=2018698 RepID=A0AAD2Q5P1_9AGAR|nr:unnamed protein product [Mycena citricolor]